MADPQPHSVPASQLPTHQPPPHPQRLHIPASMQGAMEDLGALMDFRHIFHLIILRWWVVAIITGVCTLAAAGWVMRQPKIYQSRAVMQVQHQEQRISKIEGVMQENPSSLDFINTVVQALGSRNLMLRVVDANRLRENPAFVSPGSNPTEIQLADRLRGKVQVALRRGTRLIDITVSDRDPVMARDLASSIVREFLKENFSQRLAVSKVATEFLKEEADKLQKKLEESELKLQRYKEQNRAVSLEDRQNITVERLREVSSQATEANSQRLRLEADIEQVRKLGSGNTDELLRIRSVAELPQVAATRAQLAEASAELSALQDRYGYKHPKLIAAQNRIQLLRDTLAENTAKAGEILQRQYDAAVLTESKLYAALEEQEDAALELNKIAIPYNVLQRDVDSDRSLYETLLKRMKETSVTGPVEQAPYTLVEEPMVPSYPSQPNVRRTVMMAFVVSLFIAIGGIIVLDMFDASLRSVDEAEKFLHLPALVGIPNHRPISLSGLRRRIPYGASYSHTYSRYGSGYPQQERETQDGEDVPPDALARSDRGNYPIAAIEDPASSLAEAYRTLRVSLSMLGPEEERRVLLFVSAVPEEGKTYTSLNTAAVLAQQGCRTLLIDADLRRPSLHKALQAGVQMPIGLTDFFSGNAKLNDVIQQTDIENLHLLPAGRRAPNPAELLSSTDVGKLLDQLLKKFDRIVIDSAPVNAVSDTLVLAPHANKTILVVRAGKTHRKAIERGVLLLRKSGAKLAGFVLNRLPTGRAAAYYYYYYGDKYEKDSAYGSTT
jgi:capsular exopolysaccharide synthesis family protein